MECSLLIGIASLDGLSWTVPGGYNDQLARRLRTGHLYSITSSVAPLRANGRVSLNDREDHIRRWLGNISWTHYYILSQKLAFLKKSKVNFYEN